MVGAPRARAQAGADVVQGFARGGIKPMVSCEEVTMIEKERVA